MSVMSFLDAMCLAVFVATHVRRPFWNRGNVHVLIYLRRDQQSKDASAVFRFSSRPLSRGSLLDLHLVQLFRVVTFDMLLNPLDARYEAWSPNAIMRTTGCVNKFILLDCQSAYCFST